MRNVDFDTAMTALRNVLILGVVVASWVMRRKSKRR